MRQDIAYFDDEKHSTGRLCARLATDAPIIRAVKLMILSLNNFKLFHNFKSLKTLGLGSETGHSARGHSYNCRSDSRSLLLWLANEPGLQIFFF